MITKYNAMTKTGILLFTLLLGFSSQAQTIVLEQDVNMDTAVSDYGKNRRNFLGTWVGIGMNVGQTDNDSIELKTGSDRFTFGVYYKRKVAKVYSVLLSANYTVSEYKFKVPDDIKYNNLRVNEVNAEFGNRINFGKRGNVIGNYLELGISGIYVFHTKLESKQKIDDDLVQYSSRKTELTGLKYVEKVNYSVHARLGINKFAITADYRLSDLTTDGVSYNLPPLTLGIRLDFGA